MGFNVGFEQDGRGAQFSRPIVIFKKFNNEVFGQSPDYKTKNRQVLLFCKSS